MIWKSQAPHIITVLINWFWFFVSLNNVTTQQNGRQRRIKNDKRISPPMYSIIQNRSIYLCNISNELYITRCDYRTHIKCERGIKMNKRHEGKENEKCAWKMVSLKTIEMKTTANLQEEILRTRVHPKQIKNARPQRGWSCRFINHVLMHTQYKYLNWLSMHLLFFYFFSYFGSFTS